MSYTRKVVFSDEYHFKPIHLFANEDPGFLYEVSDLTTMYQDSGYTPCAVNSPVGFILDKSRDLTFASERVTNGGPFTATTGWTAVTGSLAVVSTKLELTCATNGLAVSTALTSLTIGSWYKITVTGIEGTAGTKSIRITTNSDGVTGALFTQAISGTDATYWFQATATTHYFVMVATGTVGQTYSIGTVVIKLSYGNHAYQTTSGSRPILRQDGSHYYLEFDGIDDYLLSSSINLSTVDAISVFAGIRKLSDVAAASVAGLSTDPTANNGTFELLAPQAATDTYRFAHRGTASANAAITGQSAPDSVIITGLGDISTDSAILRIDGVVVTTVATDQGTGNLGNYPLYIGRRGGSSLPFNGRLYGLIGIGRTTVDLEITRTETWLNDKTGAF